MKVTFAKLNFNEIILAYLYPLNIFSSYVNINSTYWRESTENVIQCDNHLVTAEMCKFGILNITCFK